MRKYSILKNEVFHPENVHERLVYEADGEKIKSLHIKAGHELPVQVYEAVGETMLVVLTGEGLLLGKHGVLDSLVKGDVVVMDSRVPHGLRAEKDMCILVSLTPLPDKAKK